MHFLKTNFVVPFLGFCVFFCVFFRAFFEKPGGQKRRWFFHFFWRNFRRKKIPNLVLLRAFSGRSGWAESSPLSSKLSQLKALSAQSSLSSKLPQLKAFSAQSSPSSKLRTQVMAPRRVRRQSNASLATAPVSARPTRTLTKTAIKNFQPTLLPKGKLQQGFYGLPWLIIELPGSKNPAPQRISVLIQFITQSHTASARKFALANVRRAFR